MNITNSTTPIFSSANTAFMFGISAHLVVMCIAIGLFYSGLVRQKNAGSTVFQSFMLLCVVSIIWWFIGFTLAFGTGGPIYGDFDFLMLIGFKQNIFTTTITCSLATGGMAERVKFITLIIFFVFWIPLVYCPIAHWHWMPTGWLNQMGVLDHAGGNVVHVTSGTTALVFSLFMKKRRGSFTIFDWLRITLMEFVEKIKDSRKPQQPPPDQSGFQSIMTQRGSALEIETPWRPKPITKHSLPFVIIGTGLLWFGWFGFNGGAFGEANIGAAVSVVNTQLSAVAGACTYQLLDYIFTGKPKILTGCLGAIIGMVMITPSAGLVHPGFAVLIGFIGSLLNPLFIHAKSLLFDDTLDAAGIHLFSGFLGIMLTGIFASKSIHSFGTKQIIAGGWIDGNWIQILIQLLGFTCTFLWTFVVTSILFLIFLLLGWNVTNYEERVGLDVSQHGERAYMYEPPEETIPHDGEIVPKTHIDYLNVLKEKLRYWWVHRGQVADTNIDFSTTVPTGDVTVLQNPHDQPNVLQLQPMDFGGSNSEILNQ